MNTRFTMNTMLTMNNIIDTYLLNYSTYENGKVMFESNCGELCFLKSNSSCITIYAIYVNTIYRQHGICRDTLHYLIDKCAYYKFKTLCVESVLSKILYEYLLRFRYKDKMFKIKKNGFYYRI
jgi:hypothetical protein